MRTLSLLAIAAAIACSRPDPSPAPQTPETPAISAAPSAGSDTTLAGREWSLVELRGNPAGTGAGGRPATLQFDTAGRVAGFGGCNRIAGPYSRSGDSLRLGPLAMTRMACTSGMELETALAAALDSVSRYRMTGDTLELMGAGAVIARLASR